MSQTMFERNESVADRAIRLALGALLLGSALRSSATRRWPFVAGAAALAGTVLLITGITGSCQIYRAFNISTYRG